MRRTLTILAIGALTACGAVAVADGSGDGGHIDCPPGYDDARYGHPTTTKPGHATTTTTKPDCPNPTTTKPVHQTSTTVKAPTTTTVKPTTTIGATTTTAGQATTTTTGGATTTVVINTVVITPPPTTTTPGGGATTTVPVGTTTTIPTGTTTTTVPTVTTTTLPPTFSFAGAATVCVREVPTIQIVFVTPAQFPALVGQTGTLTMADTSGNIVSTQPLTYQPGTPVSLLYPGTRVNPDGSIADVPGWNLTNAGLWVRDPSDEFLREGIALTYVLNPTAQAFITYPPESSACANPENPPAPPRPPAAPPRLPPTR